MKFFRKIILLVLVLCMGLYVFNSYNLNSFSDSLSDIFNGLIAKANNKNLFDITGFGDLVSDNDTKSLKDSGINGSNVIVDSYYYPYYNMLKDNEKSIYKQIYANASKLETTFVPTIEISKSELKRSFMAVFYDHPELFWLDNEYSYKYTQSGKCVQIIVKFNETINDIDNSKNKFENAANRIINGANKYTSNYEKEKYVHDEIIKNTTYDINSSLNQSAYSALVNKRSVCAGYARLFQLLMIKLKIPTYFVVGKAREDHAWNIVALDDGYYNVDVTWDDQNKIIYNYFNRNDSEFGSSHTRYDLSVNLPKCNGSKYEGVKKNNTIKRIIKKYTKVIPNINNKKVIDNTGTSDIKDNNNNSNSNIINKDNNDNDSVLNNEHNNNDNKNNNVGDIEVEDNNDVIEDDNYNEDKSE